MSVQAGPIFKRYAANGVATEYAIPFKVMDAGDLQITLDDVLVTTGFTLGALGGDSTSCTFAVPPTGDLLFQLVLPFQRLTDYQLNGDLLAVTVNRDLDRIWLALKQLIGSNDRSLATNISEPEGLAPLPLKAVRALKLLAFDASSNPVVSNLTLAQLEEQPALALDSAAIAQAAAAAAALSEASAGSSATSASASKNMAEKWAEEAEDVPVATGPNKYSAKHWAAKAAASLAGVIADIAALTAAFLGLPIRVSFESSSVAITLGGEIVIAHPLAREPADVDHFMVCQIAEGSWAVGNRVHIPGFDSYSGGGFTVTSKNSTEVRVRCGSVRLPYILNKSTGVSVSLTLANWRYMARIRG